MIRNVIDCLLAIYLIGWLVCFGIFVYEINAGKYTVLKGTDPNEWPIWVWMILAATWPCIVYKIGLTKIKLGFCKFALRIAQGMVKDQEKGTENEQSTGRD